MKRLSLLLLAALLLAFGALAVLTWLGTRSTTVLVEWSTASELDTAGFNLYRSEDPQGEYIQVNTALVPASSDPLVGSSYSYEDEGVRPGRTYYYQLEEVELDGGTNRFGPISVKAANGFAPWLLLGLGLFLVILIIIWIAPRRRGKASYETAQQAEKPDG